MTDKEQLKKALSIIKKRNLLNQSSWVAGREPENVQSIFLYPTESIFSQEIEDIFKDGWIQTLEVNYKKAAIRTSRSYLSDIVFCSIDDIAFYSIDDAIKFIKEMDLDVNFDDYLLDTTVTLSCYRNCVKTLDKCIKEVEKYEKGKQNGRK